MSHITRLFVCLALTSAVVGCRKESAPAPPAANPPAPAADPAAAPKTEDAGANEAAQIEAAFASLSADDRALATAQRICPVSSEGLGTMGTPIKVEVAGQQVFICCEGCKDPLLKNPAEHLAKINLKPASEAAPQ